MVLQVAIIEHKSIICPGYSAVMHINCGSEEVVVKVCQYYSHSEALCWHRPEFTRGFYLVAGLTLFSG